ncbi:hypothetical protein [Aquitalea sp.]|uniref:hypothetical protein n=1 Tax=Aquitalea sp. TaxID=1872623 RepID=UPI00258D8F3D|nr:hypothetical protein [Aquitalea sp.]
MESIKLNRGNYGVAILNGINWDIVVEQLVALDESEAVLLSIYKMQDYELTRFTGTNHETGPYGVFIDAGDDVFLFCRYGIPDFETACYWIVQGLEYERAECKRSKVLIDEYEKERSQEREAAAFSAADVQQ